MSDASLFDPVAASSDHDPTWVVVTNRSNIIEWLSSSLTVPRSAYEKYYADSLQLAETVVPAVAAPVGAELVADAEAEIGMFCVLAEVSPDAVTILEAERIGVVAPTTLAAVRSLHVREDGHRREFLARRFDNVDIGRLDVHVSPHLFAAADEAVDVARVRAAMAGSAQPASTIPWELADRLGGARTLAVRAVAGDAAHIRSIVTAAAGEPLKRSRRKAREVSDWFTVSPALSTYAAKKTTTFDERLYLAAAAALLGRERRDAIDAGAVLAEIDEVLRRDSHVTGADRERWNEARDWVDAVLVGDSAFTRFRSADARTEKALMLALIRADAHGVLSWAEEDIRAHADDLMLAAVFVGLMTGRKTLSWELRGEQLDVALAAKELTDCGFGSVSPSVSVAEHAESVDIEVDGVAIRSVGRPPRPLSDVLDELDSQDAAFGAALIDFCRRHQLGSAVTTTISLEGEAQVRPRTHGMDVETKGFPSLETRVDLAALGLCIAEATPEVIADLAALVKQAPRR